MITTAPVPADLGHLPDKATIVTVLQTRAVLHPERRVFTFLGDGENETAVITYGGLHKAATTIAGKISAMDLSGKNVLMFYPAGIDFIAAFFGCLYAGAIAVPVYPPRKNRSIDRINAIAADCDAAAILATGVITRSFERNFSSDPLLGNLPWVATDELVEPPGTLVFKETDFQDLAYLQYTSGSTGTPKGVMVTHRNMMVNLKSLQLYMDIRQADTNVHWVPQFHDLGLLLGVLETPFSGSHTVLMSPFTFISKPWYLLRAIHHYKASTTCGPDFSLNLCHDKIDEGLVEGLNLSSLRTFLTGAEQVRKETLDRFIQKFSVCGFKAGAFFPAYGMAESTLILTGARKEKGPFSLPVKTDSLKKNLVEMAGPEDDVQYIVSNGIPNMDTEIIIVNPDNSLKLEENRVGEIWVSGSTKTKGYWGKEKLTSETFTVSPAGMNDPRWLRTGDLGFLHQGELYITGRLKNLIIINGKNFYPQDIEKTVENSHPSIRKTCVAAVPLEVNYKESLCIIAELERTFLRKPDTAGILEHIVASVSAEHEIQPARISLIRTGSIPKTSSGKMMHKAAREMLLKGELEIIAEKIFPEADFSAELQPDNISLSDFICNWVSAKLNQGKPADTSDTLIAYGIDSLKASELSDEIKNRYGIELPPYRMFEDISINLLVREADSRQ